MMMMIADASRHAKDLLTVLEENEIDICFFDDTERGSERFFNYPVMRTLEEAKTYFLTKSRSFALATGSPGSRAALTAKLQAAGGTLTSIVSMKALIGTHNTHLHEGVNIMPYVFLSNDVTIGKGSLVNVGAYVHHDCRVGAFCELAPRCNILGSVKIDDFTRVGTGATLLPGISIGKHVTIGAGAVIKRDVPNYATVVGVPGRIIGYATPQTD